MIKLITNSTNELFFVHHPLSDFCSVYILALSYTEDDCIGRRTSKTLSIEGFEALQSIEDNECEGTCFSQTLPNSCNATVTQENCRCCRPDTTEEKLVPFRLKNPFINYVVNFIVTLTKTCRCGPCS